jgi:hypothetical protein
VLDALRARRYDSWIVVEQDVLDSAPGSQHRPQSRVLAQAGSRI